MVRSNSALQEPSFFYSVFSLNYQHSVLMYVRRQVRRDPKGVSLINLADDLSANCETITEQYYISLWTDNALNEIDREARKRMAQAEFLRHFGGAAKKHLDPEVIKADIANLEAIADASSSYTDRRRPGPGCPSMEAWAATPRR